MLITFQISMKSAFFMTFTTSINCESKLERFIHLALLVEFLPIFVQITLPYSRGRFRYRYEHKYTHVCRVEKFFSPRFV